MAAPFDECKVLSIDMVKWVLQFCHGVAIGEQSQCHTSKDRAIIGCAIIGRVIIDGVARSIGNSSSKSTFSSVT
jgi:hypothetical protein